MTTVDPSVELLFKRRDPEGAGSDGGCRQRLSLDGRACAAGGQMW